VAEPPTEPVKPEQSAGEAPSAGDVQAAAQSAGAQPANARDDEPVPRLPRTTHFKVSPAAMFRIAMTAALLAMIIIAQRPCADAVSGFVTKFDNTPGGSGSAAAQMPKPGTVDVPSTTGSAGDYETLRPDMTEAELKAAIERAKQKAREKNRASSPEGSAAP